MLAQLAVPPTRPAECATAAGADGAPTNALSTPVRVRGPSAWAQMTRATPPPRPPRMNPVASDDPVAVHSSSSVSSPSARDRESDCADVDELLEGIDRVRIDDLWTTPRGAQQSPDKAPFRAGLFAPPSADGIAAITTAESNAPDAAALNTSTAAAPGTAPVTAAAVGDGVSSSSANIHAHGRSHSHPHHHHAAAHESTQHRSIQVRPDVDPAVDFPRLFKVYPCATPEACFARGDQAECFFFHAPEVDRRRAVVTIYKPHMCRFVEESGGCRKADRCPFSHNDFERRYHPDRFGKETCRDFLRGDCPRRYCTFRHEVSDKVEVSITQIDAMNDKELLQLVLKISDAKGRALSEKLLRRFGHGKKHSGWRLEGFNPRGRDDQKVRYVVARVDEVKKILRAAGEKKWAATLKLSSLRDMMSGVRKVAEEIRERCRGDETARGDSSGPEVHRLIRAVFSNTNWSCHSQEGDNPFLVTPENQNDAVSALEKLVDQVVGGRNGSAGNFNASAVSSSNSLHLNFHEHHHMHQAHRLQQQGLQTPHYGGQSLYAGLVPTSLMPPQHRGAPGGTQGSNSHHLHAKGEDGSSLWTYSNPTSGQIIA